MAALARRGEEKGQSKKRRYGGRGGRRYKRERSTVFAVIEDEGVARR